MTGGVLSDHTDIQKVAISSMLNMRVFRTNFVSAAFSSYMYIEKAAETSFVRRMLMKLTAGGTPQRSLRQNCTLSFISGSAEYILDSISLHYKCPY